MKCHYCDKQAVKTLVWLKDKQGKPAQIRLPWCGCDLMVAIKRFWPNPYRVIEGRDYNIEPLEKPILTALSREDPKTSEGKYLVKRRDGTVVEWPSFVLGARDPHAAVALRAYADSIAQDPDCHPGLPESIRRLADEFDAYRLQHGNGDPTRGLHRTDDPATVAEMRKGRSA